jgi:hypothetical protein
MLLGLSEIVLKNPFERIPQRTLPAINNLAIKGILKDSFIFYSNAVADLSR